MKNKISNILLLSIATLFWSSCSEDEYSKDYDINFPAAKVVETSDNQPFVDEEITLTGENLNTVSSVSIGAYKFAIVSAESSSMIVKVPRNVEPGILVLMNKYKREFISEVSIVPQFYPAEVKTWPNKIEKGKPFTLKGENMDLIKEVKLNGTIVSVSGAASKNQVAYATSEIVLEVGQKAIIEVTPKAGDKQVSAEIEITKAANTYMPKQTILLWDFESEAKVIDQTDKELKLEYVAGFFGKALRATHPNLQSDWSPVAKLYADNGGKGFDLTNYTHPCLTMLVNTNGKKGYVNLEIEGTIDGHKADKHMNGYKFETAGWEWFSFDLAALGFDGTTNDWGTAPDVKSEALKSIRLRFLDGGAAGDFEILLDQVLITDGPLNPTVAWNAEKDAEKYETGAFALINSNTNSALTGYSQGNKYANYSGPGAGWDKSVIAVTTCPALDTNAYQNGVWINFLVNTADKGGYIQPCMGDGWMNLTKQQGYGDDYQVNPTNNSWQWRSIKIVPGEGDLKGWNPSSDFAFKVQILGGNYNGSMNISCDYFVFTTVPLDPNLNTDELK